MHSNIFVRCYADLKQHSRRDEMNVLKRGAFFILFCSFMLKIFPVSLSAMSLLYLKAKTMKYVFYNFVF